MQTPQLLSDVVFPKAVLTMSQLKSGFTIGSDPEFFLYDHGREDFVAASRYFTGTKENPEPIKGDNFLQVDGLALEINTKPVDNLQDFGTSFRTCYQEIRRRLPNQVSLCANPHVIFSEKEWDETPDEHKVLGCSPDMNAWEQSLNSPPTPSEERLRTLGGHVHVGWTEGANANDFNHFKNCVEFVQQLDYYLGLWSLDYDKDPVRRSLYGKAGACRIKSYGVEYRVLSSFWCGSSQGRAIVFDRVSRAISKMPDDFLPETLGSLSATKTMNFNELLVSSINGSTIKRGLKKAAREKGL